MQILYSNFQTSLPVPSPMPLRVLKSCCREREADRKSSSLNPYFRTFPQKQDLNPRTKHTLVANPPSAGAEGMTMSTV